MPLKSCWLEHCICIFDQVAWATSSNTHYREWMLIELQLYTYLVWLSAILCAVWSMITYSLGYELKDWPPMYVVWLIKLIVIVSPYSRWFVLPHILQANSVCRWHALYMPMDKIEDYAILQESINMLNSWVLDSHLKLNPSKCKCMIIMQSQEKSSSSSPPVPRSWPTWEGGLL